MFQFITSNCKNLNYSPEEIERLKKSSSSKNYKEITTSAILSALSMMQQCIRYASNTGYSTRRVLLTDMRNAVLFSISEDLKSVKYEWIDQDQVIKATAISVWMSVDEFQKELELADYRLLIQKSNISTQDANTFQKQIDNRQKYFKSMGDKDHK